LVEPDLRVGYGNARRTTCPEVRFHQPGSAMGWP
jgi:hypothetical protein